ncbi:HNH endonuclease [Phormidium sp. FACHB-1136]|uniref:HNH endonuclease n=1 Tax=Phormidium sp. FACHB-1136 TaxID=2692848 RepID=UPI001683A75F|nr:HNH endonuclease [Phormidium sp. FACHB-1136]MBD2425009.1 HNH endonuclease [Phormidium sp. FACHB-1136]
MNWEKISKERQKDVLGYEILREIIDAGGSASNQFIAERLRKKYRIPEIYKPGKNGDTWTDKISGLSIGRLLHKGRVKSDGKSLDKESRIWTVTDEGRTFLYSIPDSIRQLIESFSQENYSESPELEEEISRIDNKEFPFCEKENPVEQRKRLLKSIAIRQGQPRFRRNLIDRYGCCLISGCSVKDTLEAAHIHPYAENGTNHISNGLLLRADFHTLFDLYLLAIDADLVIHIHPSLRDYIQYMELEGKYLKQIEIAKNTIDGVLLAEHYHRFIEKT